jgi:hypothetical protein
VGADLGAEDAEKDKADEDDQPEEPQRMLSGEADHAATKAAPRGNVADIEYRELSRANRH